MFNFTKAEVSTIGRTIGITIRWNNDWEEWQVYPKGTNTEHPSAYFTNDPEDAVRTAFAILGDVSVGGRRELTETEQMAIDETQSWLIDANEMYAVYPEGYMLHAIGDNVYRTCDCQGHWKYYFSLKEALEA